MKTQIFLISLFSFLFLENAHAQLTFGIKGGYHNAWQEYGDDFSVNGNDLKIKGFSTSLMAYYSLGKHIEVGVEPGYIRRGAACLPGFDLYDPIAISVDATLYANYLTAPILIKAKKSFFNKRLEFFVKGGGGPSWWVDGYRHIELGLGFTQEDQIQDINFKEEANLRRLDLGVNASTGLSARLGPGALQLSFELYQGLVDMNKRFTSKNRNAGFALGYLIRL